MDKKQLLSNSLAKIMVAEVKAINDLLQKFRNPEISVKADGSPVTKLDLALSHHIESLMEKEFPHTTFYSEEKIGDWKFPLLALDPLDGTREYIDGRAEWAISIGLFQNENFVGEGWVYNPAKKEVFTQDVLKHKFVHKDSYLGEVSRSEYNQNLFEGHDVEGKFIIRPVGSIAYKLGRLAYQNCDFVVSLRPKNIWDIAGGTILCKEAGLKFYSQGKEVTRVQSSYQPPLIWCHEEISSELFSVFR